MSGSTAVHMLYCYLIHLLLKYGSLYISISVIDPVHNSAVCLCTGFFRMNRVGNAYAELGESTAAHQQILLCSYATNLNALKKHCS
jgi:hypothetical protein